jgi:thiol-disulfide isomerase/thioredoxin
MIEVVLLTKDPCPLCEDAKLELGGLAAEYPHRLREVDITTNPELFTRYRYAIPVFRIGDREVAAPITREKLRRALEAES